MALENTEPKKQKGSTFNSKGRRPRASVMRDVRTVHFNEFIPQDEEKFSEASYQLSQNFTQAVKKYLK